MTAKLVVGRTVELTESQAETIKDAMLHMIDALILESAAHTPIGFAKRQAIANARSVLKAIRNP